MFAPTARRTPTQLPTWWWTLAVALMLLGVFAPAFAAEPDTTAQPPLRIGSWQLVSMDQMFRATVRRQNDAATPRMLPLAVMPSQRGALWFGLSGSRAAGARLELRWTMPLDGGAASSRVLDD
jgi:hypothetical protein